MHMYACKIQVHVRIIKYINVHKVQVYYCINGLIQFPTLVSNYPLKRSLFTSQRFNVNARFKMFSCSILQMLYNPYPSLSNHEKLWEINIPCVLSTGSYQEPLCMRPCEKV